MTPETGTRAGELFRLESADWSDEQWQERQRRLSELPYLGWYQPNADGAVNRARDEIIRQDGIATVDSRSREATEESVETRLIVRAPSFRDWSSHYHAAHDKASVDRGDSSVVEIGKKMAARVAEAVANHPRASKEELRVAANRALNEVFRAGNGAFMIIAKQIDGPRGPIYFIEDGSHRTAAAKLAGLPRIIARVGYVEGDRAALDGLWFDSLGLMDDDARADLEATYDSVYPPTAEDRERESELAARAAEKRSGRVASRDAAVAERERQGALESERDRAERREWDEATPRFEAYERDRDFRRVWHEEALAFLKREDTEYFPKHFNGEMTPEGRLLDLEGNETFVSVTGLDVSYKSPMQIRTLAVRAFERQFPERAKALWEEI